MILGPARALDLGLNIVGHRLQKRKRKNPPQNNKKMESQGEAWPEKTVSDTI